MQRAFVLFCFVSFDMFFCAHPCRFVYECIRLSLSARMGTSSYSGFSLLFLSHLCSFKWQTGTSFCRCYNRIYRWISFRVQFNYSLWRDHTRPHLSKSHSNRWCICNQNRYVKTYYIYILYLIHLLRTSSKEVQNNVIQLDLAVAYFNDDDDENGRMKEWKKIKMSTIGCSSY